MRQSGLETTQSDVAAENAADESSPEADKISAADPLTFLPRTAAFRVRHDESSFSRNFCGT
jgi:hypothetical protein